MLTEITFSGSRVADAKATFFLYQSCVNVAGVDDRIKVYADGTYLGQYRPGDSVRLPQAALRWYFESSNASLGVVSLLLGVGDVRLSSVPGLVKIADDSASLTLQGSQFTAAATGAANATKFRMAGLLAGAKALKIKRCAIASGTVGRLVLHYGTGAPTDTPATSAVSNKLLGGANALAVRSFALCAAITPTGVELPGVTPLIGDYVSVVNQKTEILLSTPFVVPAGYWFGVVGSAINTDATFFADFEEL